MSLAKERISMSFPLNSITGKPAMAMTSDPPFVSIAFLFIHFRPKTHFISAQAMQRVLKQIAKLPLTLHFILHALPSH